MKENDMHRVRWTTGDWTDDSDQMILMMDSILANDGKVNVKSCVPKHSFSYFSHISSSYYRKFLLFRCSGGSKSLRSKAGAVDAAGLS